MLPRTPYTVQKNPKTGMFQVVQNVDGKDVVVFEHAQEAIANEHAKNKNAVNS